MSAELPLKTAYLELRSLKIPLRRLVQFKKFQDQGPATANGTRYWRQVSFYLAPLNLLTRGARLVVDFSGQRSGFSVRKYEEGGVWPAFVRLDEYNTSSEPDASALEKLLQREYPGEFQSGQTQPATEERNSHAAPSEFQSSQTPPGPTQKAEKTKEVSLGTAFFVAPHYLLTNYHVVADCHGPIGVRYPDKPWVFAKMSGQDETNDLALLHTEMESHSWASFRFGPRLGESVAAYGFPYPGVLSASGNFTMGNITSLSGMGDDTRFLQMSAPVQPGNSGGPLLDMSGNVIGVVESQLNAVAVMQADKSVPQNVNFGIQVPIVVNFLSVKGVVPKIDSSDGRSKLTPSDVADLAKGFTVQLHCEEVAPKVSEKEWGEKERGGANNRPTAH
jgi:S1-C subfamily serine protease